MFQGGRMREKGPPRQSPSQERTLAPRGRHERWSHGRMGGEQEAAVILLIGLMRRDCGRQFC